MTDVDALGALVSAQARVAWGREFLARANRAMTESEAIAIVWAVMTYGEPISNEFVRVLHEGDAQRGVDTAAATATEVPPTRASRRGRLSTPSNGVYFNLEDAADRLGTTKGALKKYLSRHQRRDGRDTVCILGDGVRAVKVRGIWRVRFDGSEAKS